jgi:hypothetical protein
MSEESRNHVFLCHSSVDKPFVRLLAHDLAERGIQVWLDEWELRVGDSLRERIEQAILQSGWLAVVISHASVGSAWVQREISAALTDELERRSVFVLPVILDDAPIPLFLRDKIYADFRKDYAIGFRALKSRLLPVPKDSPKRRIIYDGDEEDIPFESWTFFATSGVQSRHFQMLHSSSMSPAFAILTATATEAVGINKSLPILHGVVEFRYRVEYAVPHSDHIYFAVIPMQETGIGRVGLIEVGSDEQDAPQNARSPWRVRYNIPLAHQCDMAWHSAEVAWDFRRVPDAFYSILAPRVNEGSKVPGAARVVFANIRVLEP